jgi:hypothetical protein
MQHLSVEVIFFGQDIWPNCSFFKQAFFAPEPSFYSKLSLKKLLRLLAIAPVISLAIRRVKRRNMNSHVFVYDAIAIESKSIIARITAGH